MPFDGHFSPPKKEPPRWTITIQGWKALACSYVATFACVLGFIWMFLSVQESLTRIFAR